MRNLNSEGLNKKIYIYFREIILRNYLALKIFIIIFSNRKINEPFNCLKSWHKTTSKETIKTKKSPLSGSLQPPHTTNHDYKIKYQSLNMAYKALCV